MSRTFMLVSVCGVLLLGLLSGFAAKRPTRGVDPAASELERMAAEVRRLRLRLETAESELAFCRTAAGQQAIKESAKEQSWAAQRGLKPDPAELDAILLPANGSPEEVRRYIREVLETSARQTSHAENDPQIRLLADVASENLELLLQEFGTGTRLADCHLLSAVKHLTGEADRELILAYLPFYSGLTSIVVMHEWEADAAEIFLDGLRRDDHLCDSWLRAVTKLEDDRVPEGLHRYMVHGENPAAAYLALKSLDYVELDAAVYETWEGLQITHTFRRDEFAPLAAKHGVRDALEFIATAVERERASSCYLKSLQNALKELVPYDSDVRELAAWVLDNLDAMQFDPAAQQYFLP